MKNIEIVKTNFLEVFSKKSSWLIFLIIQILMYYLFKSTSDFYIISGIYGIAYLWFEIFLEILISLLLGIFLPISIYRFFQFNSISLKQNLGSGTGAFLGILVTGCPACSISLASYLGLGSIISFIPYAGLQLKILGSIVLIYANYSILKDLKVCKISKHQKEIFK